MARPTAAAELTFRSQRAEPAGFWIRYRPARWPGPESPWLDLARAGLGSSTPGASLEILEGRADLLDDLVYLPPVPPERRAERDRLAETLAGRGLPVLAQLTVAEPPLESAAANLYDPLPELLTGELDRLRALPVHATVVWGLVAGITDEADLVRRGVARLLGAGVARLLPLAPVLDPRDKRRLAAEDENAFARLFHGEPPSERELARVAAAAGLSTRFERPPPAAGTHRPGNRLVAARLTQIADLWLKLGRSEAEGQELFRVARWIEAADHDLAVLEREGNLGVLDWLSGTARSQVEAVLTSGAPPLLDELEAEYLSAGDRQGE